MGGPSSLLTGYSVEDSVTWKARTHCNCEAKTFWKAGTRELLLVYGMSKHVCSTGIRDRLLDVT